MTRRILITDIAWPDLDIEKEVLAAVGGEVMVAGGWFGRTRLSRWRRKRTRS